MGKERRSNFKITHKFTYRNFTTDLKLVVKYRSSVSRISSLVLGQTVKTGRQHV